MQARMSRIMKELSTGTMAKARAVRICIIILYYIILYYIIISQELSTGTMAKARAVRIW